MVIKLLVSLVVDIMTSLFSGLSDVITLPVDFLKVLSTITGYGSYFVGGDLLLIFFSLILFWMSAKMILGLVVFVWKLLPLT